MKQEITTYPVNQPYIKNMNQPYMQNMNQPYMHNMNQPYITKGYRDPRKVQNSNQTGNISPSYESQQTLHHSHKNSGQSFPRPVYSQSSTFIHNQYNSSQNIVKIQAGNNRIYLRRNKIDGQPVNTNCAGQQHNQEQIQTRTLHQKIHYLEQELQELTKLLQQDSRMSGYSQNQAYEELAIENAQLTIKVQELEQQKVKVIRAQQKIRQEYDQLADQYEEQHQTNNELKERMIQLQQKISSVQKSILSQSFAGQNKGQKQNKQSNSSDLQRQNSRLTEQIQDLLSKIHNLNLEINEQQSSKQQLMQKMNEQLSQIQKLRKQVSDMQIQKLEIQQTNSYLKQQLEQVNQFARNRQKQIQEKYIKQEIQNKYKYQDIQIQNQQLKCAIQQLQKQIRGLRENMQKECQQSESGSKVSRSSELGIKSQMEQLVQQLQEQRQRCLEMENQYKEILHGQQAKLQEIQMQNRKMKNQHKAVLHCQQAKLQEIQVQTRKMKNEHQELVQELQIKLQEMQLQNKRLGIQVRTLRVQLQDSRKQLQQKQHAHSQSLHKINNDKASPSSKASQSSSLIEMQRRLTQQNKRLVDENRVSTRQKDQQLRDLRIQIRTLQDSVYNGQDQVRQLHKTLALKHDQLVQKEYLSRELHELQQRHQELIDEVNFIKSTKYTETKEYNYQNQAIYIGLQQEIAKFKTSSQSKDQVINNLQDKHSDLAIQNQNLAQQVQNLNIQIRTLKEKHSNSAIQNQNLAQQIQNLNIQIETLKDKYSNLVIQNQNLTQQAQNMNSQIRTLKDKHSNQTKQIQDLNSQIRTLKQQNITLTQNKQKIIPGKIQRVQCRRCPQILKQYNIYKELMELKFQTMNQMLDQVKTSFTSNQFQMKEQMNRDKTKYQFWIQQYDNHDKEYKILMQRVWQWQKINAKNEFLKDDALKKDYKYFPKDKTKQTQSPSHLSEIEYDLYLIKLQNSTLRSQILNLQKQLSQKDRNPQVFRQIQQLKKFTDNLQNQNEQLKTHLKQIVSQKSIKSTRQIVPNINRSIVQKHPNYDAPNNFKSIQGIRSQEKALASAQLLINKLIKQNDNLLQQRRLLQNQHDRQNQRYRQIIKDLQTQRQRTKRQKQNNRNTVQKDNKNVHFEVLDRENIPLEYIKYHPQHKKLQADFVALKRSFLELNLQFKKTKELSQEQIQKMKIQNDFHRQRINEFQKSQKQSTNLFTVKNNKLFEDNTTTGNGKQSQTQSSQSLLYAENKIRQLQQKVSYMQNLVQEKIHQCETYAEKYGQLVKQLKSHPRKANNENLTRISRNTQNIEVFPIQQPKWHNSNNDQDQNSQISLARNEQTFFEQKTIQKLKRCIKKKMIQLEITPRQSPNLIIKAVWFIQRLASDIKDLRNNIQIFKGQKKSIIKQRNLLKEQLEERQYQAQDDSKSGFMKNKSKLMQQAQHISQTQLGLNKMKIISGHKSVPRLNFNSNVQNQPQINLNQKGTFNDVINQTLNLKNQRRNGLKRFQQQVQRLAVN